MSWKDELKRDLGDKKITAEYFKEATGFEPINDDLERSNCDMAGQSGHRSCGWNWEANLPCFMRRIGDTSE